ncbi:hypothetical protein GGF32_002262 [Allomyces javanicus]|nr:hypothetical protein GGF32_002262 [Allomyces javanicus]
MTKSTRCRTLALLAVTLIALVAAATGPAHAVTITTAATKLNEWTGFSFYPWLDSNVFSVTLGPGGGTLLVTDVSCLGDQFKVSVNGGPFEVTSPRSTRSCSLAETTHDPQEAFNMAKYSHGTFKLPPGAVTLKINLEAGTIPSGGFIKITEDPYIDPALVLLGGPKVVTASGKVATRAEAIKACASQGMDLAGVSTAN